MSVTTMSRVDATHPVLAQVVDAASRGFTGALEVTTTDSMGRELQVQVWLEDGQIRAVDANGWTAPAAAFVLARTGVDLSDQEDPLKAAYLAVRDGEPLLDADAADAARRDWGYGLLASSLTWAKPRVRRIKNAPAPSHAKMLPSPWQRVTADVAARVDGLESAWRVVCDALTQAGIPPVPAGRACGVLAVLIEGHPLFTGAETLDQTAGRAGMSRYAVLEELSRAILSGAPVQFGRAGAPEVQLLVPEHWEDPNRSWGWVDEQRPDPVEAQVDVDVEAAPAEPAPELDVEPGDTDAPTGVEPFEAVDDLEELDQMVAAPAEPEPDLAEVVTLPVQHQASARQLLDAWLQDSADPADASVREAIVRRLILSAHEEARQRAVELTAAQEAFRAAEADAQLSQAAIARAQEAVTSAQSALEQAEAQVRRVEAEYADVMRAARDAAEAAEVAQESAEAAEAELTRLMDLLRDAEQAAVQARDEATRCREVADAAAREVAETAGPVVEKARALTEKVREEVLAPAQDELRAAEERASSSARTAQAARGAVEAAHRAAEHAHVLVATLGAEQQAA